MWTLRENRGDAQGTAPLGQILRLGLGFDSFLRLQQNLSGADGIPTFALTERGIVRGPPNQALIPGAEAWIAP